MKLPYWRLSSYYFFYFASIGIFLPYWNLYLKQYGFDAGQIGTLSALMIGTRIISPNLFGPIADRTGKSLEIIQLSSLYAALIFAYLLFPHQYSGFVIITIGHGLFWNACLPQFEAFTLSHLHQETHRYSHIRIWGSIGFIITVIVLGQWLERHPVQHIPVIATTLLFLCLIATLTLPKTPIAKPDSQNKTKLWLILKRPTVIAFLLVNLLLQFSHSPYYVFYSIYLKDYHYTASLIGGLWALAVCAEIVVFMTMRRLLHLCSAEWILLASLLLAALRWFLIAWCTDNLALMVFAQVLHAASFGCTHVIAITLVHRYFGSQHQGKGQAIYSSISYGLGGMLGSLCSGHYWIVLGAHKIYTIAGICCLLAFFLGYFWIERENNGTLR